MKKLDLTNESQEYWEDALEYDMARGGRGDARQKAAISAYLENKEALKNDEQLEEIKDGFDLAESTIQQIEDKSEAELHHTRPSNTNLRKLLTKFDYDDHFISGHAESAGVYGSRTHELPELFYNDAELKTFLKQMFPLANTVDRKCDCARCVFPNGKTGKHPRSAQGCDCKPCKQTISMASLVYLKCLY